MIIAGNPYFELKYTSKIVYVRSIAGQNFMPLINCRIFTQQVVARVVHIISSRTSWFRFIT